METSTNTVEERVTQIIARIFRKEVADIGLDTHLTRDLFAKSVTLIELTAILESEFEIEIPGIETRKRKTVGELVDLVKSLQK